MYMISWKITSLKKVYAKLFCNILIDERDPHPYKQKIKQTTVKQNSLSKKMQRCQGSKIESYIVNQSKQLQTYQTFHKGRFWCCYRYIPGLPGVHSLGQGMLGWKRGTEVDCVKFKEKNKTSQEMRQRCSFLRNNSARKMCVSAPL